MRVSVVMAAYNGAEFIEEQLQSIMNQTRKADEVIICDDCSSDRTVHIVEEFVERNKLDNWFLIINENNIGWRKNFINAVHMAKGDIIFLADQDDIWKAKKIEIMSEIMEEQPHISILASNIKEYCETGGIKRTGHQLDDYGTGYIERVEIDKMWLEPWRPGCSVAFRKSVLSKLDKVWFEECPHDLALWAIGIAKKDAYIVNQRLIYHRLHGNNNSPSNKKMKDVRVGLMDTYIKLSRNILGAKKELDLPEESVAYIKKMEMFFFFRKKAMENGSIKGLCGLLRYLELYPKKISWIADVISTYRE